MRWKNPCAEKLPWAGEISSYDEKLAIAKKLADRVEDGQVIGVGSGSTAFVALQEIAKKVKSQGLSCLFVPTSRELQISCAVLGLVTSSLLDCRPDWYFDGADEVDPAANLIKGRGGAMHREKLIMVSSAESYILVDSSKFVDSLGEKFAVPVEVAQEALNYVEDALFSIGAEETSMRMAVNKDGPVVTESGNFILDVKFREIDAGLEKEIKGITGVVESGLFWGYKPEIVSG